MADEVLYTRSDDGGRAFKVTRGDDVKAEYDNGSQHFEATAGTVDEAIDALLEKITGIMGQRAYEAGYPGTGHRARFEGYIRDLTNAGHLSKERKE